MNLPILPWLAALGMLCLPQVSSGAVITFTNASDYDTNFYEVFGGDAVAASGGTLNKAGTTNTAIVYSPGSTGATVVGSGGTTTGPEVTFGDVTVRADFSMNQLISGTSLGIYTGLSSTEAGGYLSVFRFLDGTGGVPDFRVFEEAAANSAATGSLQATRTFGLANGAFTADTFYTLELNVRGVGTGLEFSASIFNGNSQMGNTVSWLDTSVTSGAVGQVGFRFSTNNGADNTASSRVDNISIAVPEPGTAGLLVLGGAMLFLRRSKRRL